MEEEDVLFDDQTNVSEELSAEDDDNAPIATWGTKRKWDPLSLDNDNKDVQASGPKESLKESSIESSEIRWGKPANSSNEQTEVQWGKPANVPTIPGQIQDWGDAKDSEGVSVQLSVTEQTHFNEGEERKEVLDDVPVYKNQAQGQKPPSATSSSTSWGNQFPQQTDQTENQSKNSRWGQNQAPEKPHDINQEIQIIQRPARSTPQWGQKSSESSAPSGPISQEEKKQDQAPPANTGWGSQPASATAVHTWGSNPSANSWEQPKNVYNPERTLSNDQEKAESIPSQPIQNSQWGQQAKAPSQSTNSWNEMGWDDAEASTSENTRPPIPSANEPIQQSQSDQKQHEAMSSQARIEASLQWGRQSQTSQLPHQVPTQWGRQSSPAQPAQQVASQWGSQPQASEQPSRVSSQWGNYEKSQSRKPQNENQRGGWGASRGGYQAEERIPPSYMHAQNQIQPPANQMQAPAQSQWPAQAYSQPTTQYSAPMPQPSQPQMHTPQPASTGPDEKQRKQYQMKASQMQKDRQRQVELNQELQLLRQKLS